YQLRCHPASGLVEPALHSCVRVPNAFLAVSSQDVLPYSGLPSPVPISGRPLGGVSPRHRVRIISPRFPRIRQGGRGVGPLVPFGGYTISRCPLFSVSCFYSSSKLRVRPTLQWIRWRAAL